MTQLFIIFLKLIFNLTLLYVLPISRLTDILFFCLHTNFTLKKIFIKNFYSEYRLRRILSNLQSSENREYVVENFCNILSILYLLTNLSLLLIFLIINFFLGYPFYKSFILLIFISYFINYFISVKVFFFKKKKNIINFLIIIIYLLLTFLTMYLVNSDAIKIINILLAVSLFANLLLLILLPHSINFSLKKKILNFTIFQDYRFIHFIDNFFKSALVSNIFYINFIIFLFSMNYKIGFISISCVIFNSLIFLMNIFSRKINIFIEAKLENINDDKLANSFKKNSLIFIVLLSFFLMFSFLIIIDCVNLFNAKLLLNFKYFSDAIIVLKVLLFCLPSFFIINYFLLIFYTGSFAKRLNFFFLITIGSIIFNILINFIFNFYHFNFFTPFVFSVIISISAILFLIYSFKNHMFSYHKFYFLKILSIFFLMFFIYFISPDLVIFYKIILSFLKILLIFLIFYYVIYITYKNKKFRTFQL